MNVVLGLWRHAGVDGAQATREASRAAPEWRAAIATIAEGAVSFDTQLLAPTAGSGWQ